MWCLEFEIRAKRTKRWEISQINWKTKQFTTSRHSTRTNHMDIIYRRIAGMDIKNLFVLIHCAWILESSGKKAIKMKKIEENCEGLPIRSRRGEKTSFKSKDVIRSIEFWEVMNAEISDFSFIFFESQCAPFRIFAKNYHFWRDCTRKRWLNFTNFRNFSFSRTHRVPSCTPRSCLI